MSDHVRHYLEKPRPIKLHSWNCLAIVHMGKGM